MKKYTGYRGAMLRHMFCVLVGLLLTPQIGSAARPSWPSEPLSIHVQDQPLRQFLTDLFAAAGMRVLVNDSVEGQISGTFDGDAEETFKNVVKAYGLLPYFDGAVTHISMTADVQSRSFELNPEQLDRILKSLVARDLSDDYQSVHVIRDESLMEVRGAPEFILAVEEIVRSVVPQPRARPTTTPSTPTQAGPSTDLVFRTFSLKYASATDVTLVQGGREFTIPGVASILRSIVGDGQSPSITSMRFGPSSPGTVPGLRQRKSDEHVSNADLRVEASRDPTQISSGGVITDRPFVTRIEAERNLNAVIIRDYADAMPVYQQLILQLDQEPALIEIQVTIIDVDRSELRDLGIDWQYSGDRTEARLGGGSVLEQNGGLLLNTVLGDARRFISSINALAVTGSADVVSRPQVLTLSNLEAVLANDQSFFVRVAGREDVDLFNVSVGTTLRVIPNIVGSAEDPQIRLLVSIEDGSLTPEVVDDIPIVDKSTLSTQAIIYDGESLLLGGLVRDSAISDERGVPLLGDIPGLRRIFKRTTSVETTTERLFLITPRLVAGGRAGEEVGSGAVAAARTTIDVQARTPEAYLDGF